MKKIKISVNKQSIEGTLFYPENLKNKNPAVLFVHGWASDESGYKPRAEALTSLGYICLTISLRGHGKSSGKLKDFSRQDHLQDVIKAYDFLTSQKEVDARNINVVGASYGAYLAAILATKKGINSLAMRSPAFYLNEKFTTPTINLVQNREDEFFQKIRPESNSYALIGLKAIKRILLIESERDQIIPHRIIQLYKSAISDKTKLTNAIIRGADHQLSEEEWKKEFITILSRWFGK